MPDPCRPLSLSTICNCTLLAYLQDLSTHRRWPDFEQGCGPKSSGFRFLLEFLNTGIYLSKTPFIIQNKWERKEDLFFVDCEAQL
jgi:hypothetical protein